MTMIRGICALLISLPVLLAALLPAVAQTPTVANKSPAANCDRSAFRVVVDVGHTNAGGALSARGAFEYDFNLRLAGEIEQSLIDAGFTKTMLVVTTDARKTGLFLRSAVANSLKTDLFLSIHHDAVPDRMLEKWDYNGVAHQYCDRFRGHSIFISRDNADYGGSLLFAQMLGNSLKARDLHYTPHYVEAIMGHRRRQLVDPEAGVYRYDQLIVLRTTRMPAVLLEAGSIVNRDEEVLLTTPEHRARICAAATEAVEAFCAARAAHPPAIAAKSTVRTSRR